MITLIIESSDTNNGIILAKITNTIHSTKQKIANLSLEADTSPKSPREIADVWTPPRADTSVMPVH